MIDAHIVFYYLESDRLMLMYERYTVLTDGQSFLRLKKKDDNTVT